MRSPSFWLFCVTAAGLCAVALGQEPDAVTLENRALRLTLRKVPSPHISELMHKATGTKVVSNPAEASLFGLSMVKEDGKTEYIDSARATETTLASVDTGDKRTVRITFSGFPDLDLTARATATCSKGDALTRWSIAITNRSGRKIQYVRFPLVTAVPQIGAAEDDVIVLPYLPGSIIERPWLSWKERQGAWLPYPGNLSAQFIAFQDRTAGIYFSTMDTGSHPRRLEIWKMKDGFHLGHDYNLSADVGQEWKAPYAATIGVTQGTWCDSADIYKAWAVKQSWCAKTLAQRADIPQWWKDGPLVHVCEVRKYDKDGRHAGSYYPRLLDHLRYLKTQVGGPIVVMLAGWENHRRWTGGDYFPIFDEATARTAIPKIKADGFRPFLFLSGLYYTFENQGLNGSKIASAGKHLAYFVVDKKTGKPKVFKLNESSGKRQWCRHSYEICVGTPFAKPFFRNVIDRAHDLGITILQMDQTVSGGCHACYSTEHEHVPGVGSYQTVKFHELLRDMQRHGKKKSKDFVLFHEEPHEELIPYLDGFHVREYKEKWWYRGLPGAVGSPLFSYLYHEYAIGYGGDSARIGKHDDPWMVRMHAVNMVTGRTPGVAVWSYPQQLFESHPDPLAVIRHHCELLKTSAKDCLMLGRMLHPYELDVPPLTYKIWTGKGKNRKRCEFVDKTVLTSSWQAPDGAIGHLFVNISREKQTVRVPIGTRNAPSLDSADVRVYSSSTSKFAPLWQGVTLPKEWVRGLEPLEVVFVELRKAK